MSPFYNCKRVDWTERYIYQIWSIQYSCLKFVMHCSQFSCIFVFRTDKYYIVELSEDWVIRLGSKIEILCNGNWLLLMSHIYISTDACFVLSRTYQLARVKYLYSYIYYIYILYIYVIYIYIYNIAYLESIHTIVVFKLTNDSLFWCLH